MQPIILGHQLKALSAALSRYPDFQLVGSGMHADSLKNWFVVEHLPSGRSFSIDSADASDFFVPRFENLLKAFS